MKKVISMTLALVMAASLAACGGGASSGSSAAAQSTPAPTPESTAAEAQDSTASAGDDGTLYGTASADIESTVSSLTAAYEALTADIATYDDYVANVDRVEAFYATVIEETRNLCIRLREYGADYVDSVLSSGLTCDEMYDELDVLYDDLYDDAGGDVYDEIYDDLMGDLYDVFYDGILKDAYDTIDYSDWADTHSNEYDFWSDAHSDIYDEWSDFHSDIYDLWSDVRGELWDDDLDRAAEKLADFRADLQSLKEESAQTGSAGSQAASSSAPAESTASGTAPEELVDGMRPDFKNAMDSYETFMGEYCDFMAKYNESDGSDLSLLSDYASFLSQYAEMAESFEAWASEDLTDAETAYYLEVQTRVSQKLMEVAG